MCYCSTVKLSSRDCFSQRFLDSLYIVFCWSCFRLQFLDAEHLFIQDLAPPPPISLLRCCWPFIDPSDPGTHLQLLITMFCFTARDNTQNSHNSHQFYLNLSIAMRDIGNQVIRDAPALENKKKQATHVSLNSDRMLLLKKYPIPFTMYAHN